MILREGMVALFLEKCDASKPESYRPIVLLSHLRKAISSGTNAIITKACHLHPNQCGVQNHISTEQAIVHANEKIRKVTNEVSILDLRRAYDMVPRNHLVELCNARLLSAITTMIIPLLVPMKLKTKGQ